MSTGAEGKEVYESHCKQVPNLELLLAPHHPPHSKKGQSTLTQHVLKDLVQSICVLQNEGMSFTILLGPQFIQFSPVHIQLAHPNSIDI